MAFRQRASDGVRNPLAVFTVALIGGALAAYRMPSWYALAWLLLGLSLLAAGAALSRRKRLILPACGLWAGGVLLSAHAAYLNGGRLSANLSGHDQTVTGVVSSLPAAQGDRVRFLFDARSGASARRLRLAWYRIDPRRVRAGQCLRLKLHLHAPRGLRDPGVFDYSGWLFRNGIGATGYVKRAHQCHGYVAAYPLLRLRAAIAARQRRLLGNDPMLGIVQALTIGYRGAISSAQWRVLRATGTSHLVAISGLHVGIVAAVVFFVFRFGWSWLPGLTRRVPAPKAAILAALAAALGYAALAGFSLPTQRAVIMLLAASAGVLFDRRAAPSHLLALAALGVLCNDPMAIGSPSFWLSFSAVAWLIYAFAGRMHAPGRVHSLARSQWVLLPGLLPLTLVWFGQSSLVSPLANLVMLPLSAVLIPALLIATLLLPWPVLAQPLLQVCTLVFAKAWWLLTALSHWPAASVAWHSPPVWSVVLALAGVAVLLMPRGLPGRWLGVVLCAPLVLPVSRPPPPGVARVTVLDVGQGLAVAVVTHRHTLVFDTGPSYPGGFNAGARIVVPFLRRSARSVPDRIVVSHSDRDHSGGLGAIRRALSPLSIWGAGGSRPCRAGQHWRWDGVGFRVLWPPRKHDHWSDNNASCVVELTAAKQRVLLIADIEAEAERELVQRYGERLRADVMLVPHHGSATSSTSALLHAVDPRYAIASLARDNRWHFPRPSVMRRYRDNAIPVLTTADAGAITFVIGKNRLARPTGWRLTHPRLWTLP